MEQSVLDKLMITHIVKKFSALFGNLRFITVITKARKVRSPVYYHFLTSWVFTVMGC